MSNKMGLHLYSIANLTLLDKDGKVKESRVEKNLITDAGFDFLCQQIAEATQNSMVYSGVGSGSTAANASDTTLELESARESGTYAHTGGTKVFTNTNVFGPGVATGEVREAGLLNESSSGSLLNRVVFSVINKGASDSLQVEWTGTLSEA